MRGAFAEALLAAARGDERIVILTGDLGFGVLDELAAVLPDRFFNVGVAEQNMVGMATGLAEAGFVPYAYSIGTFASMRGYEFIRNGPALHALPVRVVGVGSGFGYGLNGVSHYALEDVALMRVQPRVGIVVPADPRQAAAAVGATVDWPGPLYFRLGKETSDLAGLTAEFELGRLQVVGDGEDVLLVALGSCARQALEAATLLAADGVAATVAVVTSFNPDPSEELAALLARIPAAVVIEDHYAAGGLGSLVAEVAASERLACRLEHRAVRSMPVGTVGSEAALLETHGLSAAAIAEAAVDIAALTA